METTSPRAPRSGRRAAVAAALAAAVAAALAAAPPLFGAAGCAQQQPVPEPSFTSAAAPAPSTVSETTKETATTPPPEEAAPSSPSTKPAPEPECASLPKDPLQQYPSGTAPGRMPNVDGTDYNYWIADIENHYDPCAPVSWIIFRGSLGDERGPAGTGASITDGIAFYINGKPDGEMRTFTSIENVALAGPNTVIMTWGERTGATAEGITAHYSVTLEADPGGIQAIGGELLEFTDRWYSPYGMYMLGTYD
ncbi:hypothetical protein JZY91_01965 [Corynebacterium sp. CNCTC7651]|uniref:hypothetical protein n=1 Tax=Corynebacterium sp. CNCTC7651 TaxID=2815361 RepID=UPI001F284B5C|nr:hypothetical protein [Corynebacterium sp. CNCTC7651]UIZ92592.1 hypothetical protein JZY91_01965 [Corynebacterium sp. CNCTC7651]